MVSKFKLLSLNSMYYDYYDLPNHYVAYYIKRLNIWEVHNDMT